MYYLVLTIHIIVCFFLMIVVLLQSGKAADLAGAFGGMGSQTAFGPRGSATLLSKATTISAVIFMITSMTLSIMMTRSAGLGASVLEQGGSSTTTKSAPAKTTPAPAVPPAPVQSAPAQTQTPAGGITVPLPIQQQPGTAAPSSAPAQSNAPAKAPPAPAKK